ncbi:uncharacterized protein MONOS_2807 [Monocercomonoides exilis]|uniref:uncharacterized protein n=1 Tax=Monocercomonoides exilis TaxID=2049356 RepID=UPI00355A03CB|nr:hypothetical protein MONOS_2807 [Monocercomonoides exilis]|eukprot:MONOS_2807.1-p1 / transcript=MONOS_2807.1 / gene=MONOS_2807 / organism=Monocercomonoides_exilis_PA203 / gene_product=unspecified product / transcript_product=unspecified product / location=Mono_scaffold00060:86014-86504(+) / protein_length=140 / sequence_SO=supercontig / SO=protein_coding / is_pseudo=false
MSKQTVSIIQASRSKKAINEIETSITQDLEKLTKSFETLIYLSKLQEKVLSTADEVVFEAEAESLISTIESLLTSTSHLKENVLMNDYQAITSTVLEHKRKLQQLADKSQAVLSAAGKDLTKSFVELEECRSNVISSKTV